MIFTLPTTNFRVQGPLRYLAEFFKHNTLVLLDEDTNGADRNQWLIQFDKIKKFVADNNIQTIVVHAGINPVKLDWSQNSYPTFVEMQQQLSTITATHVLTGDFYYHYNLTPGIVFFPTFVWLNSSRRMGEFFEDRANTVYDIDFEPKTKTLMCLNSNTPWHRIYLFSLLANKPWFNNIGYSFHARTGHQPNLSFQDRLKEFAVTQFMSAEEITLAESYAHLLPVTLPEDNISDRRKSSVHSWIYQSYAINLATETSLTEGVMLTEKICKAFTAYQIPVLIAPAGSSQFLEDLGMDMFGDYIPWQTWDSVADHKTRIGLIVDFLDRLFSSNTVEQDILSAHRSFQSRLIKNKQHFHSKEFENLLLNQIKSCTNQDICEPCQ
jgi:hypothetical protein